MTGSNEDKLRDSVRPRVFQIGFNRCGTTSLLLFFRLNGYTAVHRRAGQHARPGTLAVAMELARREDRPLLTYVGRFDLYTDMEKINLARDIGKLSAPRVFKRLRRVMDTHEPVLPLYGFLYFDLLDAQYPGSRFILNTRDVERWVESRLAFNEGKYRSCIHGDRYHATDAELADCWRRTWHDHHRAVQEHFRDRPKDLLVFDIEKDGPQDLIDFLPEFDFDPLHWGKRNART